MSVTGLATVAGVFFLISATGVGYALCGGQGPSSSVNLVWTGTPTVSTNQFQVVCGTSQTSTKLTVTVSHLAPGGSCTVHGKLLNTGSLAGTLGSSAHITQPSQCLRYVFSDNVAASPPHTLSPGKTYAFVGTVTLLSGSGNACQGTASVVTDLITLTASCSDSDHDGDCDSEH